jgi:hypothetical protein
MGILVKCGSYTGLRSWIGRICTCYFNFVYSNIPANKMKKEVELMRWCGKCGRDLAIEKLGLTICLFVIISPPCLWKVFYKNVYTCLPFNPVKKLCSFNIFYRLNVFLSHVWLSKIKHFRCINYTDCIYT